VIDWTNQQSESHYVRMESVSLVTSMYNAGPEALAVVENLFFPSLFRNGGPHVQLLLLDDGSPLRAETRQMIQRWQERLQNAFGEFRYLENDNNLGFSASYNRLMQSADGRVIVMANDDIYFPAGAIPRLVSPLMADLAIGTVAPLTDYAFSFQNTRLFRQLADYSEAELGRIEQFDKLLQERVGGTLIAVPFYDVIGFCQAFRKADLERLGYFDPAFEYGTYEDRDLNKRLADTGAGIVVRADTFVKHGGPKGGSLSIRRHDQVQTHHVTRNRSLFSEKHGSDLAEAMEHRNRSQYWEGRHTIDDLLRQKLGDLATLPSLP